MLARYMLIATGLAPTRAPNTGVVGSDQRFSTNISLNLRNGARKGHSYYRRPIDTCMLT